jgi:hypothetical protein
MPLLFQYDSNTNRARLNDKMRLDGAAEDLGRAETVDEYDLAFDVWSGGQRLRRERPRSGPRHRPPRLGRHL